jgi:isoamylase
LIYNAHHDVVNFTLPQVAEGRSWLGLVDTNQPEAQLPSFPLGHCYVVAGRSLVALGLSTEDSTTRRLQQGVGAIIDVMESPLS